MYMTGPSSPPYWKQKSLGISEQNHGVGWGVAVVGEGGGELRVEREEREKAQKRELA